MNKMVISTLAALALFSYTPALKAQNSTEMVAQTASIGKPQVSIASLPTTTGPYQVGTDTFDWVDPSREDLLSADPHDHRELMVQAWYPIDSGTGKATETYIPATDQGIQKMMASMALGKTFANINQLNTQAFTNSVLSSKESKYPIVLFSHGLGCGSWNYQWLTRELASQGFIVFSIEHTHFSFGTEFDDGRFVPIAPQFLNGIPNLKELDDAINQVWVKDIQFVIRQLDILNKSDRKHQFMNRLDLHSIAAVGHSFGGAAAARALQVEPMITSAINLDGAFVGLTGETGNMTKPFAFIATEFNQKIFKGQAEQPLPPGLDDKTVQIMKDTFQVFRTRYQQAVEGAAYDISISGADHMSFTDMPLLRPYLEGSPYAALQPTGINPDRIHKWTNSIILAFLEKTLRGKNNTIFDLDDKNVIVPEVTIIQ